MLKHKQMNKPLRGGNTGLQDLAPKGTEEIMPFNFGGAAVYAIFGIVCLLVLAAYHLVGKRQITKVVEEKVEAFVFLTFILALIIFVILKG